MNYKYRRRQIFGKRLKISKHILNKVYNCTLSFNELIEYGLQDKIPLSCIVDSDKKIVEKFGLEKSKLLDWELLNKSVYYNDINFKELLMSIETSVDNVNEKLYELTKDRIRPSDYSSKMQEIYSKRLFKLSENTNEEFIDEIQKFNKGEISLQEIIINWNLYKGFFKNKSYNLTN